MSGPFGSSQWMYASGGFYNGVATQSLRFDDGSSAYLSRTPASAGNRKTWTWSGWVKRSLLGSQQKIMSSASASLSYTTFEFTSSDTLQLFSYFSSATQAHLQTSAVFRDISAWYHIVVYFDAANTTAKFYVNGIEQSLQTNTQPSNQDYFINSTNEHRIGRAEISGTNYFDGYLAEVNFVDGTALDPTSFGETKNGVWIPKAYTGSYGTNGFRLQFNQTGTGTASSSTIGADTSGNDNHFDSSGIVASDCDMPDSPENNFATLNVLDPFSGTISEGNLKYNNGASFRASRGTFAIPSSGKWYFEVLNTTLTSGSVAIWAGVASQDTNISAQPNNGSTTGFYGIYNDTTLGILSNGSQSSSTSNTISANSILQFAIDADNNKLFVGIDNSYYSNATTTNGDPSAGTNPTESIDLAGYRPFVGAYNNTGVLNTGQDSTFAGAITAGGNTDANGIGDFKYSVPSGYLALCTANLPEPTISPNADTQADDYFNTVEWTGNATVRSISGVGFQADWLWFKRTDAADNHHLIDSVRGLNGGTVFETLYSNLTNAEANDVAVTAFNSDGFDMQASGNGNTSGRVYVGWNWKAGGTAVSNTDGSITSSVSANTDAGFSIVSYTGNGTSNSDITIGHSLGITPRMVIVKNRTDANRWQVYHEDLSADGTYTKKNILLNSTSAESGYSSQIKAVSSTTFTVRDVDANGNANVNKSGSNYIAYCFAEIDGYSKFGSYTGNGSTDGTFVYLGFRPAWLLIKKTDGSASWWLVDAVRDTYNPTDSYILPDTSDTDRTYTTADFVSNGFKIRNTSTAFNSGTHIYMAFAETPFKYALGR